MATLSLATAIAIGGAIALIFGNTLHAAIERRLDDMRNRRSAREAGERIAARIAAGDPDP